MSFVVFHCSWLPEWTLQSHGADRSFKSEHLTTAVLSVGLLSLYFKPIQFPFFAKETASSAFTAQSKISFLSHWSSQEGHVFMHVTTGYSCTVVITPSELHSFSPNIPHVQESICFLVHKCLAELSFPGCLGYVVLNFHHQSDSLLSDYKKSQKKNLGNFYVTGPSRAIAGWEVKKWEACREFWF